MKKLIYMLIPAMALMLASCENEEKMFDDLPSLWLAGDEAQGAVADSVLYSFRLYDFETQAHTLNLVVTLTGHTAGHDREFELEVVADKTNVAASDYTIGTTVLPKGEYRVVVPVGIRRTASTVDLEKEAAKLTLRVVANDNFEVGRQERKEYSLVWCDFLIQPETWSNISWVIGAYSQERYKFIIDFTGYTEFSEFASDYTKLSWLQARLVKALDAYNSDPANEGRPEGWPYMETLADGSRVPLQF